MPSADPAPYYSNVYYVPCTYSHKHKQPLFRGAFTDMVMEGCLFCSTCWGLGSWLEAESILRVAVLPTPYLVLYHTYHATYQWHMALILCFPYRTDTGAKYTNIIFQLVECTYVASCIVLATKLNTLVQPYLTQPYHHIS